MIGVTPGFTVTDKPLVIGVDEAGRGPLAGPVVAAAVVLCPPIPVGLDDSKRLSAQRRAVLDEAIRASCCWAVAVVEPDEIDRVNIFMATMHAMTRAVASLIAALEGADCNVLIDGNMTPAGRCAEWFWPARAHRGRGRAGAVHIGGLDHRKTMARPADAGGCRRSSPIRLGTQ